MSRLCDVCKVKQSTHTVISNNTTVFYCDSCDGGARFDSNSCICEHCETAQVPMTEEEWYYKSHFNVSIICDKCIDAITDLDCIYGDVENYK